MTQHTSIIKELRKSWLSGIEALHKCGTMKLASRVSEIRRQGYIIEDKWVESNGKRFKSYRMSKNNVYKGKVWPIAL